jgi:glycosyltransferase involved in cell wall biosynthesis
MLFILRYNCHLHAVKIAWIVNNFPAPQNSGVAGIFFERMLNNLPEEAGTVHVVAPVPFVPSIPGIAARYQKYTGIPPYEERGRLRIHRPRYLATPREHYTGLAHFFKFLAIIRLPFWREITLVDARYTYPNGAVARLLKKWKGIPYVVAAIGTDVNVDPLVSRINRLLLRKTLRSADGIIAVSNDLAGKLRLHGATDARVIHDGIDTLNYTAVRPFSSPVVRLAFLGEISDAKGIPLISELIARYPHFAGPRYEWHLIGNAVQKFGLDACPNVTFYGQRRHEEALNILSGCDIMVYPSLNEGIPNALKEAGMLGLVVVASDTGGIPELLMDGDAGYLFRCGDVEHFYRQLSAACENRDEARAKANTLNRHVREAFDVRSSAAALFGYYQEITTSGSGRK